jgi:hypothetical protein
MMRRIRDNPPYLFKGTFRVAVFTSPNSELNGTVHHCAIPLIFVWLVCFAGSSSAWIRLSGQHERFRRPEISAIAARSQDDGAIQRNFAHGVMRHQSARTTRAHDARAAFPPT